jgi:hypothetical protein
LRPATDTGVATREMVPARGYAKGGNAENVEFGGIAA